MASKSAQQEPEKGEVIEELLDDLDLAVDRVKVLYEQYFLGIQKQPPSFLHTDIERKIRDLSQHQIRNTALRYRFVTLQQKFGAYHAYWRRTLRQIENGTYVRSLSKLSRQAARTGEDIPEEILAAMPKRMREQIRRDREAALSNVARRRAPQPAENPPEAPELDLDAAVITSSPDFESESETSPHTAPPAAHPRPRTPVPFHLIDEGDADFDVEALFAAISSDDAPPSSSSPSLPVARPAPEPAAPPPVRASSVGPAARESRPIPKMPRPAGLQTPPAGVTIKPAEPPPARVPLAPSQQTRALPILSSPRVEQPAPPELAGPFLRDPSGTRTPGAHPTPVSGVRTPSEPAQAARPAAPPVIPPLPKRDLPPLVPPPAIPSPPASKTQAIPTAPPAALKSQAIPVIPPIKPPAPRPTPAAAAPAAPVVRPPVAEKPPAPEKAVAAVAQKASRLPPGMTDADVNALYAKYVKAKEMVGEKTGPGAFGKLVQTINAQAPKIIEQYKAKAVDFSVVVKDNQVIIRAKPKS